ncbi:glutathione transferase [Lophiostoma macrostomum CBS 122681]|uniref:Glutathione transferase n=1 Tax=Lophiostoma macrostomum CBS 122681 TaxID=1314788 RepID=A0A6A6SLI9_9PLEO|nr:glutathione transferase [Lophiostoma macrostomum CBS 122681]
MGAQHQNKTDALWKPGSFADADGHFRRPPPSFKNFITTDVDADFPAEVCRYVLYVHYACPWAHRALITRKLKGLDDIVEVVELDDKTPEIGWTFGGRTGPDKDPRYGFKYLKQLYEKAVPGWSGRSTVPALWDTKKETIVSNESTDIINMFYDKFDAFLPEEKREANKGETAIIPPSLKSEIATLNEWVYDGVNNGVYKTGFASTRDAYEESLFALFSSLDRLEEHLGDPAHQPYLYGKNITDADIRLFTTLIRFDAAYFTSFRCNLKMIRYEYPRLHLWLRNLYWDQSERTHGAFHSTVRFDLVSHTSGRKRARVDIPQYKEMYAYATVSKVIPKGPLPHILPL